ncbi:hypothetical protein [Trebonia sp.]|uniref:hypothetical protein n=1 Tax=Trebonia sp. TaxID=2767075 RepID=UPI0026256E36|nr:hypothetical protein [Trebonia sp.]
MLALTAATYGQDPTPILIALGALAAAVFWRFALKIALALVIILLVVLFIHLVDDETALVEGLRRVFG